ncbi:hypothetical protein B0I35DRAFT_435687 [Stachybotrys elegans]|uniref:Calcineurin-like phosphoesterase domain-containing protein n=1 Tax=Stachybotrys elegans TaxID=80388 RepID=A0A8K0WPD8_9HYPO|nr:hypothetical protein B0I35DRAFT_435687 [Stachybotrys elegans]
MYVVAFLRHGLRLVVPLAIACSVYLYLYPFFNGCAFPVESRDASEAFQVTSRLHWPYNVGSGTDEVLPSKLAPFRLLALGDPQLEGDTSIPATKLGYFPHLKTIVKHVTFKSRHSSLVERTRQVFHEVVDFWFQDVPNALESLRKHIDLFGNDYYLGHIYRTLHWWTKPTHVTVLGDLLGSQWIGTKEFERRGRRFWDRVFLGAERLPDEVAVWPKNEYNVSGVLDGSEAEKIWTKRLLNVAGNHDIGYAGDLTRERVNRFERLFGKVNYELRFELPITDSEANSTIADDEDNFDSLRLHPEIRIIVINDMNLDTPAKDSSLQDETYSFVNAVISTSTAVEYQGIFTLVLTHIPMHKPHGTCVDSPFFDFHSDGSGVKEQNMLSFDASKGFLEGVFGVSADTTAAGHGMGRPGLMLNGHDHEGCGTYHFINHTSGASASDRSWEVMKWGDAQAQGVPTQAGIAGRREITVRSMMGDFGGNAGLLSLWFDQETWEWKFEYADCPLGTQHFWWLTHILILIAVVGMVLYGLFAGLGAIGFDLDAQVCKGVACLGRQLGLLKSTKGSANSAGAGAGGEKKKIS